MRSIFLRTGCFKEAKIVEYGSSSGSDTFFPNSFTSDLEENPFYQENLTQERAKLRRQIAESVKLSQEKSTDYVLTQHVSIKENPKSLLPISAHRRLYPPKRFPEDHANRET